METLTRLELTTHEADALWNATSKVRKASLSVCAFVSRHGSDEALAEAAALFLELNEAFSNDPEIRIGALNYGYEMATYNANRSTNYYFSLQHEFLRMVFSASIADRGSQPTI